MEHCYNCNLNPYKECDICYRIVCIDCLYNIQEILDLFRQDARIIFPDKTNFCFKCSYTHLNKFAFLKKKL